MAKTLRLTALGVKNLKEPGLYNDGLGLHLQVTAGKETVAPNTWAVAGSACVSSGVPSGLAGAGAPLMVW